MPRRPLHLLDLHQNLLVDICRVLSFRDKVQLQLVCKSFHSLLDDPAPGSGIWGVVNVCDLEDDLTPEKLYWWLLKRAAGIQSLQHLPDYSGRIGSASETTGNDIHKKEFITRVLPRLAKVLPQGAGILLDLRWASAQSLFARERPLHKTGYMFLYWGALSTRLTKLKLAFEEDIAPATSAALNQLTRLEGLMLEGWGNNAASLHLQLPKLTKLTLFDLGDTILSLECPQLKSLKLLNLKPLQEMSRLPENLERLCLCELAAGSVPFEQMIPAQGLNHLSHLTLHDCPRDPTAVQEVYDASKLLFVSIDEPWAPLLPSQPPWQGLPCRLREIKLRHPLVMPYPSS